MQQCEQMKGLSVLQHGQLVREYYLDLYNHLKDGSELKYQWKIPDWMIETRKFLIDSQMDQDLVEEYQIFHDCGKPFCASIDEQGRTHFPNHAQVSSEVWESIGGDTRVVKLISKDMLIHTIKDVDVLEFSQQPEALTLLLTGIAEIHANCAMFGGLESTSFKIKWKQINQRGKAILKCLLQ